MKATTYKFHTFLIEQRHRIGIGFFVFSLCVLPVFAVTDMPQTESKGKGTPYSYLKEKVTEFFSSAGYNGINPMAIMSIEAIPTQHEVLITWNASTLARGKIYYATTSQVSMTPKDHWVPASEFANYANSKGNIRYLQASTTYYFKILLEDKEGNRIISDELSFSTRP